MGFKFDGFIKFAEEFANLAIFKFLCFTLISSIRVNFISVKFRTVKFARFDEIIVKLLFVLVFVALITAKYH